MCAYTTHLFICLSVYYRHRRGQPIATRRWRWRRRSSRRFACRLNTTNDYTKRIHSICILNTNHARTPPPPHLSLSLCIYIYIYRPNTTDPNTTSICVHRLHIYLSIYRYITSAAAGNPSQHVDGGDGDGHPEYACKLKIDLNFYTDLTQ